MKAKAFSNKPLLSVLGKTCQVDLIPIFDDNYVFIGRSPKSKKVFVVDPGEDTAVSEYIKSNGLELGALLLTHEHDDHIGGAKALLSEFPNCQIYTSNQVMTFLPELQAQRVHVKNDSFNFEGIQFKVLFWPGHTVEHLGFFIPEDQFVFTGDILFGLGCGKVIGGTYPQHFSTMKALSRLPDTTKIFCAHEYSVKNLEFIRRKYQEFPEDLKALLKFDELTFKNLENHLKRRLETSGATVPLELEFEKKFNPFLRSQSLEQFEFVRKLKNRS